jgi:hypothetical protein
MGEFRKTWIVIGVRWAFAGLKTGPPGHLNPTNS